MTEQTSESTYPHAARGGRLAAFATLVLAGLTTALPVQAQDEAEPAGEETQEPAQPPASEPGDARASEDEASEEQPRRRRLDTFTPSEEIFADSAIAFPVDI